MFIINSSAPAQCLHNVFLRGQWGTCVTLEVIKLDKKHGKSSWAHPKYIWVQWSIYGFWLHPVMRTRDYSIEKTLSIQISAKISFFVALTSLLVRNAVLIWYPETSWELVVYIGMGIEKQRPWWLYVHTVVQAASAVR